MKKAIGLDGGEWVLLSAAEYLVLQEKIAMSAMRVQALEARLPVEDRRSLDALPDGVRRALLRGVMPIIAWRKHRRMSQAALAAAAGVSAPAMHYIERAMNHGRPATRAAIAAALDVPLAELDSPQQPRPKRRAQAA